MNSKTLSNLHRFGKAGRIIITVMMVITILITAICMAATMCLVAVFRYGVLL